jgi:hypothetical protein
VGIYIGIDKEYLCALGMQTKEPFIRIYLVLFFVNVGKPKRGALPDVKILLQEVSDLSVSSFLDDTTPKFFEVMRLPSKWISTGASISMGHPSRL